MFPTFFVALNAKFGGKKGCVQFRVFTVNSEKSPCIFIDFLLSIRLSPLPLSHHIWHTMSISLILYALSIWTEKIRVGKDYQTVCPDFIPLPDRKLESLNDRALLVWSPTKDIPDNELEKYICVAKEKYGYNGEQALGMLFWHKHDLERAVLDLANFTPFPDEWTEEDKVLFEQAFQFHGKSFHRIRQMVWGRLLIDIFSNLSHFHPKA